MRVDHAALAAELHQARKDRAAGDCSPKRYVVTAVMRPRRRTREDCVGVTSSFLGVTEPIALHDTIC